MIELIKEILLRVRLGKKGWAARQRSFLEMRQARLESDENEFVPLKQRNRWRKRIDATKDVEFQ